MAHWRNSNFQTEFFIAGQCHTPDEAYRVLRQQKEERDVAIAAAKATCLRNEAKIIRAKETINDSSRSAADILEAKADLAEIEAYAEQSSLALAAAMREVEHINRLLENLAPLRKYSHLADAESDQACQREEWALKLAHRARVMLFTQGSIPSDHFEVMISHPDFKSVIAPQIKIMLDAAASGKLTLDTFENNLLGVDNG